MSPDPVLQFLGAARTVTGSKTLIDLGERRVLVDCGLFQGHRKLRRQNWQPLPFDPASFDAVVLTHAHIDHCGYLPRLVQAGFRGPVFCTPGTHELAEIVLPDSAHLQEEEAEFANRHGYSKHDPAMPLYTADDARRALELIQPVPFGSAHEVVPDLEVTWRRAGHILGASSLSIHVGSSTIAFSGDLGRPTHPLLLPPDPIGEADVVVIESTYGDREHAAVDPSEELAAVVNDAASCGGVVVVPAFAVDRTEVVLWYLDQLVKRGMTPRLPVVVDSPMASKALDVYRREVQSRSAELRPELFGHELFGSLDITETRTTDESKALNGRRGPMIIISASGMATGGRVVHHLAQRIGDGRNTVVLVGFQAPGTRGDALRNGAESIKMLGRYHEVHADVVSIDLSTHADRSELLDWLGTADRSPVVYVNHGEEQAATELAGAIGTRSGLHAIAPVAGERVLVARATRPR